MTGGGTPASLQGISSPSGFAPFPELGRQPALARQSLHPTVFLSLFPLLLLNITKMPAIVPRLRGYQPYPKSSCCCHLPAPAAQSPPRVRWGSGWQVSTPNPKALVLKQNQQEKIVFPGLRDMGLPACTLLLRASHLKSPWDTKVDRDKRPEP